MKSSELAIQFVNYKTKAYLRDSVAGVINDVKGSGLTYGIYILENDSGDDLSEFGDQATVEISEDNLGFGGGHNLLAALHDSTYVLLANPDIQIVQERTIERLVTSLEHAGAAAIGPRLVTKKGRKQKWDHGELAPESGPYSPKSFAARRDEKGEVAWSCGAFLLIKTAAFRSVQGFDDNFFLYKEEEDLCLRLRQQELKTYYDPAITVMHYGSVVASKTKPYFRESVNYYNRKHGLAV